MGTYLVAGSVGLLVTSALFIISTDNVDDGYALIKDMAPTTPQEYILKAVALTMVGQEHDSVRQLHRLLHTPLFAL